MNTRIYNYSIHLIARQDYSEFKLRRKLMSKPNNTKEEVDEVILKLLEKKLINEEGYKRLFIRKWMFKGESESKIRMRGGMEKLEFSDEEFINVRQEMGVDDSESLENLIHKKLRSKEIPSEYLEKQKLKDKVLRFLISKGHSFNDAKKGIEAYLNR